MHAGDVHGQLSSTLHCRECQTTALQGMPAVGTWFSRRENYHCTQVCLQMALGSLQETHTFAYRECTHPVLGSLQEILTDCMQGMPMVNAQFSLMEPYRCIAGGAHDRHSALLEGDSPLHPGYDCRWPSTAYMGCTHPVMCLSPH